MQSRAARLLPLIGLLGCCPASGAAALSPTAHGAQAPVAPDPPEDSVESSAKAEVAILSTLHGIHEEVPGYDFEALGNAVLALQPDVLCMEIDVDDLATRKSFGSKVEYPRVVLPLLDEQGWIPCVLEPSPNEADKILAPFRAANADFHQNQPASSVAFGDYAEASYTVLKRHWTSAPSVNDEVTDAVFAGKHAIQEALIGDGERSGWAAWNAHFEKKIVDAARAHPGKRIVALVGAEHGYWLRASLRDEPSISLLNTATLLRERHQ